MLILLCLIAGLVLGILLGDKVKDILHLIRDKIVQAVEWIKEKLHL